MFDIRKYLHSKGDVFDQALARLEELGPGSPLSISGLAGSFQSVYLAQLHRRAERHLLIVAVDAESARTTRYDIAACTENSAVTLFDPARLGSPTSAREEHVQSIETLQNLLVDPNAIVVCDPSAFALRVPHPNSLKRSTFAIKNSDAINLDRLTNQLAARGFERKDFVESVGDFAVRGGIVDIFPFVGENPVRVELMGDQVESIREFDPLSQRSIRELASAMIVPNILRPKEAEDGTVSLLDYLQPEAIVVMEEPELIRVAIEPNNVENGVEKLKWADLQDLLSLFRQVHIHHIGGAADNEIQINAEPQPAFNGSVKILREAINKLERDGYSVVLTAESQSELSRLRELLDEPPDEENGLQVDKPDGKDKDAPTLVSRCQYSLDALHAGFILHDEKVALFTEHQIFHRQRRRWKKRKPAYKAFSTREIHELRKGDYVVHEDHGIGRFGGLHSISVRNITHEVVKLLYEEGDILYVNLNYLERIKKYSSREGHVPKLSRLGTADWERLKSRAKKRIKDIARDLIQLYARRKSTPGFAFQKDTAWQKELEASFIYEDTFDQAKATLDVKEDMESPNPMDRLICGDVGFGKTEVAVRAAFKAVLDGKQVAVLVPTTILALQHYNTFVDRMARYSTNVQVVSRFKSKKEQAEIVRRLKAGSIDIIIGTHRLLSKDIEFKDLGLLIIDEEHRFGVSAKENLRQLRTQVDTLTLTATPIPRTLHFSLLGARDLSIIATPPRNRLPVITEITQYNDELIKEAILRETHRGGQVYFVHDQVQTINQVATRVQQVLPNVRARTAHGQMPAHELEDVMLDFLQKRFDVLVCTKIIESGLDIPNVNTIIVNRADKFGMAELYQLRGRVGRSNIQAYAYLLTPPLSVLTRNTLHRLQAVEEFTALGSGFNLAMRDLEIRGAGNLLGGEQSGFIETLGFETYSKILDEAVGELKEQEFQGLFEGKDTTRKGVETAVEVDFEALIPSSYVGNDTERLTLYRRLYAVETIPQLEEIAEEMIDRFGAMPAEVDNLLSVIRIKHAANRIGFSRINIAGTRIEIDFPPQTENAFYQTENFQTLIERVSSFRDWGLTLAETGGKLKLFAGLPAGESDQATIESTLKLLENLAGNAELTSSGPALQFNSRSGESPSS